MNSSVFTQSLTSHSQINLPMLIALLTLSPQSVHCYPSFWCSSLLSLKSYSWCTLAGNPPSGCSTEATLEVRVDDQQWKSRAHGYTCGAASVYFLFFLCNNLLTKEDECVYQMAADRESGVGFYCNVTYYLPLTADADSISGCRWMYLFISSVLVYEYL